jgi:hypothetical protein
MADGKIHAILGDTQDWGTESADFRNMADDVFPGEQHRTIMEKENMTEDDIEWFNEAAPLFNEFMQEAKDRGFRFSGPVGQVLGMAGQPVGLRAGLWDQ